ncbi:spermidine hydroxycinnamoyl transferase-like [Quillaja saponaria]|uniref:Spermidine hydroxycinnamoyl transferase-like n=1 Tax=Quillaja saponaria TaxID=32244 RepID=A0AAD7LNQ0_QUISA|nr:spermidine hydroxycinnamoyl transferase-like [Quillaja saponaria]
MAEYGDFKPTDAVRDLVPKVDYHSNSIVDLPLLMVQLTRFSCGGLCVGVAISHSLADGLAAVQFINSWAKLAREDRLEEKDLPFLDRTVLKSSEPPMAPRFEHTELKDIRSLNGPHTMSERMKETSVTLLRLTKEQVEKLKKKANEDGLSSSQSRPYSRFEVIAGHIWRLNRPLPANYFGNAVLRTRTSPRIIGDIVSNPLSYSAQSIREGIEMLTQENLRSQLDFIAGQEDVSWLRGSFHTLGCMEAPFTGNPDMLIGVWTNIPMYEADFGWGGPLYIGPALLNADGKSFIMSCPSEDGALTIALRFQTIHMESFKKFFYDDI